MKFGSRARLRSEAAKSENLGQRSAAPSTNLSLFNERSRVILGQVLCWDYMLDTLPRGKRDSTVSDKISNAGLIRTITARTKRKETSALAVIILRSTNSSPPPPLPSSASFCLSYHSVAFHHQQGFIVWPVI